LMAFSRIHRPQERRKHDARVSERANGIVELQGRGARGGTRRPEDRRGVPDSLSVFAIVAAGGGRRWSEQRNENKADPFLHFYMLYRYGRGWSEGTPRAGRARAGTGIARKRRGRLRLGGGIRERGGSRRPPLQVHQITTTAGSRGRRQAEDGGQQCQRHSELWMDQASHDNLHPAQPAMGKRIVLRIKRRSSSQVFYYYLIVGRNGPEQ
jgi:hypothetical protein